MIINYLSHCCTTASDRWSLASFCQSSLLRLQFFYSILRNFCIVVYGSKSKDTFIRGQNRKTLSHINISKAMWDRRLSQIDNIQKSLILWQFMQGAYRTLKVVFHDFPEPFYVHFPDFPKPFINGNYNATPGWLQPGAQSGSPCVCLSVIQGRSRPSRTTSLYINILLL